MAVEMDAFHIVFREYPPEVQTEFGLGAFAFRAYVVNHRMVDGGLAVLIPHAAQIF